MKCELCGDEYKRSERRSNFCSNFCRLKYKENYPEEYEKIEEIELEEED